MAGFCAVRCFHVNYCAELKESHVNLKLTIVDTVGFADQIDKTDRYVQSRRDLYR